MTDTLETTLRLLREVNRDNVYTYWQSAGRPVNDNLEELQAFMQIGKMTNVHINASRGDERVELHKQSDEWKLYIEEIRKYAAHEPALLLEFVKDDDPQQFIQDAHTLKNLTKEVC